MQVNQEELKKLIRPIDSVYKEYAEMRTEHAILKLKLNNILNRLKPYEINSSSSGGQSKATDLESIRKERDYFKSKYLNTKKELHSFVNKSSVRYQNTHKELNKLMQNYETLVKGDRKLNKGPSKEIDWKEKSEKLADLVKNELAEMKNLQQTTLLETKNADLQEHKKETVNNRNQLPLKNQNLESQLKEFKVNLDNKYVTLKKDDVTLEKDDATLKKEHITVKMNCRILKENYLALKKRRDDLFRKFACDGNSVPSEFQDLLDKYIDIFKNRLTDFLSCQLLKLECTSKNEEIGNTSTSQVMTNNKFKVSNLISDGPQDNEDSLEIIFEETKCPNLISPAPSPMNDKNRMLHIIDDSHIDALVDRDLEDLGHLSPSEIMALKLQKFKGSLRFASKLLVTTKNCINTVKETLPETSDNGVNPGKLCTEDSTA